MPHFNKVILIGHMTRDPEMRYAASGTAIAAFGLGINRSWTDQSGQKRQESTFVDVTAFGKQAEVIAQYVKKGDPFLVEGRLKLDQWEDKQTGAKRSKLGVVVEGFQFLGGKRDGGSAPASAADPFPEEDDVPF